MKICYKCQINKSDSEFQKKSSSPDGMYYLCKVCRANQRKLKRIQNPEKYRSQNRKNYKNESRDKIKDRHQRYRNKHKLMSSYKLSRNLRSRVWHAIKNNQKYGQTIQILGCSIEQLKQYLESQFKDGMNWDNYGINGWHLDHIKPCASFDLSDKAQQKKCFHYTNIQPLWWWENLSKSSKY